MVGVTLVFRTKVQAGVDDFGDATYEVAEVSVDDCLVAPVSEPVSVREQQAMHQSRDQVRIHLPKVFAGDVSGACVAWGGKTFRLDSDGVVFMDGNTPTRWNRYLRAEAVDNYVLAGVS